MDVFLWWIAAFAVLVCFYGISVYASASGADYVSRIFACIGVAAFIFCLGMGAYSFNCYHDKLLQEAREECDRLERERDQITESCSKEFEYKTGCDSHWRILFSFLSWE